MTTRKKKNSRIPERLLLAAALLAAAGAPAQRGYQYMRPLENVPAGWNRIVIPGDMFGHLNREMTDIRIWRIEGKDTTEVPYVLQVESQHQEELERKAEMEKRPPSAYLTRYEGKYSITEDKPQKRTVIRYELPQRAPVSCLCLQVADTFPFRRYLRVYAGKKIRSGARVKQEFDYYTLYSGFLESGNQKKRAPALEFFPLTYTNADILKIEVDNEDNPPLHFDSLIAAGPQHRLLARFPAAGNYQLVYDHPQGGRASYDIVNFDIPATSSQLVPGAEQPLSQPQAPPAEKKSALFENKAWLYGLMALLVLMIAGMTLGMMRNKDKEKEENR